MGTCSGFEKKQKDGTDMINRYPLPWRTGRLVALTILLSGCTAEPTPPEPPPPKVTVRHPEERELVDYNYFNGSTAATETVEIRSRVRGHLLKVNFQDGQIVKKGDLLFEIDPRQYKAGLDAAEAQIASANAALQFAKAEYARVSGLVRNNAASREERDVWTGKQAIAIADAQKAEAAAESDRLDLGFCKIDAPITGKISRAQLTEGNLVNAGGSPPLLTTIVSINPMNVYFPVDERSMQLYVKYRRGKPGGETASLKELKIPFEFGLDTDEGYPHKGVIDFAEVQVERGTGTRQVRGVFNNENGQFVPGSRVRVRVPVTDPYKAILVPDTAVLTDQDKKYLLVVDDKNIVHRRDVNQGKLREDGMRVILPSTKKDEGISLTDWVIVEGLQRARINYPVDPVKQ
jgi:RND family efflux transporter MFP subunit